MADLRKALENLVAECRDVARYVNGEASDDEADRFNDALREAEAALADGADSPAAWQAMIYAPLDGTEVELLLHHPNWRFTDEKRGMWEQVARAKWIDHNGGGWTWEGMYGVPMGWRHPAGVQTPKGLADE